MTIAEKLTLLEELMDIDEGVLTETQKLADIEEWDSLSALALTLEVKKRYDFDLTSEMLKKFVTVSDICEILK